MLVDQDTTNLFPIESTVNILGWISISSELILSFSSSINLEYSANLLKCSNNVQAKIDLSNFALITEQIWFLIFEIFNKKIYVILDQKFFEIQE